MDETVVIHGTALDRSQFDKMATVGADLVSSPISNLVLYGNTTDVRAADAAGVPHFSSTRLGAKWFQNNLHELKVADLWNKDVMNSLHGLRNGTNGHQQSSQSSKMGLFVGQLKAGMYADIVVLDTFHDDPYRNLIEAIDNDVRLTVVQGKAVFGDVDIMTAINQDDWEPITGGGVSKAVDVTSLSEVDGSQTWASIESSPCNGNVRNEFSDIKANWNDVSGMNDTEIHDWLNTTFDGDYRDDVNRLKNMTVDPIFTTGDERYFDVLNRSSHGNTHVDLSKIYAYYEIPMDNNGQRTGINVDLTTDPANSGNTGGNDNLATPVETTTRNTGGNDNSGNPDITDNTQTDCQDGDTSADCVQQDSNF